MKYFMIFVQFVLIMIFTTIFIYLLNLNFLQCPNKDMLLWDANIRMIQAIDFFQYIFYNDYLSAFKVILDSPTWPPLRSIISIIIILFNGKPDPVLDTRVSIIFFIFTILILFFGTLYYFNDKYKKNLINKIIIFLSIYIAITFLFLLDQIPEYLFNSMLEIQGMFLYTFFLFLIYHIYKKQSYNKKDKWIFFTVGFLIYLTKYPYGVLISISFIIIEFIRDPEKFLKEIYRLISYYKSYRLIFILLPVMGVLMVIVFPYISSEIIKTKFIKNFIYISILISFIELNIFLYKNKIQLFSNIFGFFYKYFIFPFSVIILSHPDRFHSLLGAQADTIDKGRSFFRSIFYDYFINSYGFSILMLLSFAVLLYYLFIRYRYNIKKYLAEYPVINIILFLWIHFFILEFLTTNHQARYIFQIIPGLLLFHSLIFLYVREELKYFIILCLGVILISNLYYIYSYPPSKRNTCFAGKDKSLFEPARIIAQILPEDTKALIFNEFHEYKKYGKQLNNPYLFIPTDIDVHIRYKIFKKGFVLNYSKYMDLSYDFKNYIYITHSCKNELKNSPYFRLKHSYYKTILEKQIDPYICLKIYKKE
ncbi:MAG: hypothetical protein KatS3mg129_2936 [Leptospiraceae bacterium]|nr:MAG: hypothetical protein KatS3mg129_2936 [Leptospiraceae bacterium]